MGLRGRKKKEVIVEEEEVVEAPTPVEVVDEPLSFSEFYSDAQSKRDYNKPCHPDWYMLGASASQYKNADTSLESPEKAYKKYLKKRT